MTHTHTQKKLSLYTTETSPEWQMTKLHDNKLTSSIPQYVHIYIYQNTTAYDKMFNFVN